MPRFVRTYDAEQWDGTNLDAVIAAVEQRGPGTAFGPVTEQAGVVTVPSGIIGDLTLLPGWWFVANDEMGEFLSDEDFQARYRQVE
ncbi:hypothetical protein [Amycolatopsis sp. NPDC004625]|uniref:hypothetical protein n=1 Tax=Amycolatopsis sp. NPDC004625 TaxID=3154670 RepID=UPI0033B60336